MAQINNDYKIWNNNNKDNIVLNNHFCFIQIPKTASSNFLEQSIKKNLVKTLPCYRHEGLLYIEQFITNPKLPIYAIVRNPFTHIYSYFFHRLQHEEIKLNPNFDIIKNFEEFCKSNINNIHLRQCDYIKSNKNFKVKFFKFEDMNSTNSINDYIIKTHNIDLELKKTHYNKNTLNEYNKNSDKIKSFFKNKNIVDLIIEKRKEEFKQFNYSTNINDKK